LFLIPIAVLFFFGTGCLVTKSSYDNKAAENDSLRSALAELNREKAKLTEQNTVLLKLEADGKEREAALAEEIKELDRSLKRLAEGLSAPSKTDEKRMTIREQFIQNLIESEKAVERRIEELAERVKKCEQELSGIQKGSF
jgi:uncharacterized protein YaaN involved in tellurite resistance